MAERSKAPESGHLSNLVLTGVGSNPTVVISFPFSLVDRLTDELEISSQLRLDSIFETEPR